MSTCGGLFDGAGLLAYGLHLAGFRHEWLCEVDPWRRTILSKRFPEAHIYDDIRAVGRDALPVTLVAGGFPCKGASTAGKLNGFDHPETVLWREMARVVRELRPKHVLIENVANLLAVHDGALWGEVLGDLAALGYDVVWDCIPAAAVGAPHLRDRVFAVATHADGSHELGDAAQRRREDGRPDARGGAALAPDAAGARLEGAGLPGSAPERGDAPADASGDGVREQPVSELGGGPSTLAPGAGQAAADSASERRPAPESVEGKRGLGETSRAGAHGVAVEWGEYEPAIRRWEAIAGPAPLPLVRRVDDRGASRVDRSRLSALGDGVQVQVGQLVGAYIMELEIATMP